LLVGCAHRPVKPEIRDLARRPVTASEDPVNRQVAASTVDGLVLAVTINGTSVHVDQMTPARIPTPRREAGGGDRVTAVGFAAGSRVSETSVPDGVLNVQEGGGLVRLTKRQVVLSLPAPHPLDTVEISAPATQATARVDVTRAYAAYCKAARGDPKVCPKQTSKAKRKR
jgi:hypothetical protein